MVLPGDGFPDLDKSVGVELKQLMTRLAIEMVMFGVAVLMLVNVPFAQDHPTQKSSLNQFAQCSINGGTADFASSEPVTKMVDQVLSVEVIVVAEHFIDDDLTLRRHPFSLRA